MAEKITIKSCVVGKTGKSNGKDWTIYNVLTEDGRKFDAFSEFKAGETCEVEITPNATNPLYNAKIARPKTGFGGKPFVPKDDKPNQRGIALTNAVNLLIAGKITNEQLNATREKFFNYINQGI
jgi:hypothetical protein